MDFSEINLINQLQQALVEVDYQTPTPIQAAAIPPALEGQDILGCAQTGTGKTAAFTLPILDALGQINRKAKAYFPKALILAPTRELVIQIGKSLETYGKHLFLRHTLIYGGVSEVRQIKALKRGTHIVVATPGRLIDLMQKKAIRLSQLEHFVLDEADRMMDMGFLPDLERIMNELPDERQSLFFSATIDQKVAKLARGLLNDPFRVDIAPEYPAVDTVEQHLCYVETNKKRPLLLRLLHELTPGQTIVFVNKKHTADKITQWLNKKGFKTDTIHGNKRQTQRERILNKFRKERVQILVATDVASRGLDIDGITHVFNYDLPFENEDYIHRIGRTGRAGAEGVAVSFCATHEKGVLKEIEALIGFPIAVMNNPGDSATKAARKEDNTQEESVESDNSESEVASSDVQIADEANNDAEVSLDEEVIPEEQPSTIDDIVEPEPTDELAELLEIPMTEGQQNKPEPPQKRSLRKSENPPRSEDSGPGKMKVRPTPKRARISEGVIVKLSSKGFGFIKSKSGKELYFHMTSVFGRWRFDSLGEGQRVSYKRVKTDKGHVAEGVKGLEEPPEQPPRRRFNDRRGDSRGGDRRGGGRSRDGDRRGGFRREDGERRGGGRGGERRSGGGSRSRDGDRRGGSRREDGERRGGGRGGERRSGGGGRGRAGDRRGSGRSQGGGRGSSGRGRGSRS